MKKNEYISLVAGAPRTKKVEDAQETCDEGNEAHGLLNYYG